MTKKDGMKYVVNVYEWTILEQEECISVLFPHSFR